MAKVIVVTQGRFFEECYDSRNTYRNDPGFEETKRELLETYRKSVEQTLRVKVDEIVVCGINDYHSTVMSLKRSLRAGGLVKPDLVCLYAQYKMRPIKSKSYNQLLNLFDTGIAKEYYKVRVGYVSHGHSAPYLSTRR